LTVFLIHCSILCMVYICSFFFSSRRRHTRCYRDWSSDVCSSDLLATSFSRRRFTTALFSGFGFLALLLAATGIYGVMSSQVAQRSEERRVGKECRYRRWTDS